MCLFDLNLGNIYQIADNEEIFVHYQLTETITFSSYS